LRSGRHANSGGPSRKNETSADGLAYGEETVVGCRGKVMIRCNTPVVVEDMLRDVASKVDVIFDKVSKGEEEDAVKLRSPGDESVEGVKEHQEIRLLEK
jgi:hypothetical protein